MNDKLCDSCLNYDGPYCRVGNEIRIVYKGENVKECQDYIYDKVVYPHWIENDRAWVCSKCKGWGLQSFAFCPHCGKKMVSNEMEESNNE